MLLPHYTKGYVPTPDGAARIPFVQIGSGGPRCIVVPGAGDGVQTVTEAAWKLALFYRRRAKNYELLVLSRRDPLPPDWGVERHADDLLYAAEQLGWTSAIWELNSAGGPVGQWAAIKRPEAVQALILSVTMHRTSEQTRQVLQYWIDLLRQRRWAEFTWSSIEYTFRPKTVARYRLARPLLPLMARPGKHPERAERMLAELLTLDNSALLPQIAQPTLVIGGEDDRVIPAEVQREMATLLPHSQLVLYPGYGHGNDQENPDYERQVMRFAAEVSGRSELLSS